MKRSTLLFGAVALAVATAACGSDSGDESTSSTEIVETTVAATEPEATDTTAAPETTEAPETTTAATEPETASTAGGESAELTGDAADAAAAWSIVFDSSSTWDDVAPHVADAAALQSTFETYAAAGNGMGGITLEPTAVEVDGTTATITYDVSFGGTPTYQGQVGTIDNVDGTWTVPRDEFCSVMASARMSCPA